MGHDQEATDRSPALRQQVDSAQRPGIVLPKLRTALHLLGRKAADVRQVEPGRPKKRGGTTPHRTKWKYHFPVFVRSRGGRARMGSTCTGCQALCYFSREHRAASDWWGHCLCENIVDVALMLIAIYMWSGAVSPPVSQIFKKPDYERIISVPERIDRDLPPGRDFSAAVLPVTNHVTYCCRLLCLSVILL